MANILAALIISIIPQDYGVLCDSVDVLERNFYYDDNGQLVFEQLIFWEWSHKDGRHNVREWRLIRNPSLLPTRDWTNGGYVVAWMDGEYLRRVRSPSIREDWQQYDVELAAREFLPKEKRRELTQPKKR